MRGRPPKPLADRFWGLVDKTAGCWLWVGYVNNCGYGRLRPAHSQPKVGAHRLSWELTNGPIPDRMCVLHKCDNPACVNPEHLFLGTVQDNVNDMRQKGRDNYTGRPKGSRNKRRNAD